MQVLYKFRLDTGVVDIGMPKGAEVLTVRIQRDNEIVVWVRADPNQDEGVTRRFSVATAEEGSDVDGAYVGTVAFDGIPVIGEYVLHVFDQGEVHGG